MPLLRSRIFAFSVFTFDAETGELVRSGRKLRMPDQASQVLAILLDRAGSLVPREELRQVLWPNGEFVEYDDAINRAVSQIRTILRDNSRVPRFIETIPKRGYRFIGEVKLVSEANEGPTLITDSKLTEPVQDSPPSQELLVPDNTETTLSRTSGDMVKEPGDTSVGPLSLLRRRAWFFVVAIVAILLAAIGFISTYKRKNIAASNYIYMGIAPLDVSGSEADKFAQSFRLDLTDALSQLPGVQVRAAHSFGRVKLDNAGIREVSQTLQLDVLLIGEFKIEGRNCTVQFELVRGRDAAHLASFRYQGSTDDLASIRDRVVRELYTRLELTRYASHPVQARTTNPRAYEAYLRARYYYLQQKDESLHKALEEFGAALTADPSFAKAYSGMASVHVSMCEHGLRPREDSYRLAKDLASRAIAMDSSIAEAHAILGYTSWRLDWNFREAEKELRRAVELDPNQAIYHLWLAILVCEQGRFDESFVQVDRAHAVDPFFPAVYLTEAFVASSARQNARMIESAQKLVKLLPEWSLAHSQVGWTLWYVGRYEEAVAEWRQAASLEHDQARAELEDRGLSALRRGGPSAYARVRLEAIQSGLPWAHAENDFLSAEWYAYAGEQDQALDALEDMAARRQPDVLRIAVNPAYTSLRQEPRFLALASRIGLQLPPLSPGTYSESGK